MSENKIDFPSAETLDTGGWSENSNVSVHLYLVPAGERENGIPLVTTFTRFGSGMPERAYHGRWLEIGHYGPGVVGESVLAVLESMADELVAASDRYQGTRWDGNNLVGTWSGDNEHLGLMFGQHELAGHWTAEDWYGGAGIGSDADGWVDLASDVGVDPRDALTANWETVVARVADLQDTGEHTVSGVVEYLTEAAADYRENAGKTQSKTS